MRGCVAIAWAGLAGCSAVDGHDLFPRGSATAVGLGSELFGVHPDEGALSRLEPEVERVDQLDLGGTPTRLAPLVPDRLVVSLRSARSLALVRVGEDTMELERTVAVGAEPFGVVARQDATRVYVAVSQEDAVLELDGGSLEVLRSWVVEGQPRWLALHTSGDALFVAPARDAAVTRIDLVADATARLELPPLTRALVGETVELAARPSGDPAISPRGDVLLVPVLAVDHASTVDPPTFGARPQNGFSTGGPGLGVERVNPAVVGWALEPVGGTVVAGEPVLPFFVAGSVWRRGQGVARGAPTSVQIDPSGRFFSVTLGASDAVATVALRPFVGQGLAPSRFGPGGGWWDPPRFQDGMPYTPPPAGGFWERPVVVTPTLDGPSAVVFAGAGVAYVHEQRARSMAELDWAEAVRIAEEARMGRTSPQWFPLQTVESIPVAQQALSAELEAGRWLFHSAVDRQMSASGSGVACATCHVDGRDDGLTWALDTGPRQTPSLAGPVSATPPFTWTEHTASVGDVARIKARGLMGGSGLGAETAAQLEAYVDWIDSVDRPGLRDAAGEARFRDAGCVGCHALPLGTDGRAHALQGLDAVDTPALAGVATTAPYLHDGSAPSLRALLEGAHEGVPPLTADDVDVLEAYLLAW